MRFLCRYFFPSICLDPILIIYWIFGHLPSEFDGWLVDWLIEWRNRIVCVDWTEERQNSNNSERSYIIHGNLVTQLNNMGKAMWNIHKTDHTKNSSKFDVSTWLHATSKVGCVTPLKIVWFELVQHVLYLHLALVILFFPWPDNKLCKAFEKYPIIEK